MYHVYELTGVERLAILSDDDWNRLTAKQRTTYRLRTSGLRTGLEAVMRLVELDARSRAEWEPDRGLIVIQ